MSRPGRRRDDGSLPMAMLLIIVGVGLSGVVAAQTVSSVRTARDSVSRGDALQAAQTGMEAGLAHIRAVRLDTNNYGLLNTLPCAVTGSVNGAAAGAAGQAQYTVTVTYYDSANATLACRPTAIPDHAVLTSVGRIALGSGTLSRTLTATYTFQSTIENVSGGQIHLGPKGTVPDLCMDAAATTSGTGITWQACDATTGRQQWAYNQNLTVELVSTRGTAAPMCLDTAATPHAANQAVILKACTGATTGAALWRQQWSYNDNSNLEGTADGSTLDGFCFNNKAGTLALGSAATSTCRQYAWDAVETMRPDATVGSGAAPATLSDATTGLIWTQLTNYDQFGRCLDVPASSNPNYVTLWPCKQQPNPANLNGNQKWVLPVGTAQGPIQVDIAANGNYTSTASCTTPAPKNYTWSTSCFCLWSPNSIAAGQYVDVAPCDGTNPQKWVVAGRVVNSAATWAQNWTASYVIKDYWGRCLAPAGPTEPYHTSGYQVSRMVVATCDGGDDQKWNAPSMVQTHGVANYAER